MTESETTGRTGRQLIEALQPSVACFNPCDFHVHSPSSFDICQSGRLDRLPEELRTKDFKNWATQFNRSCFLGSALTNKQIEYRLQLTLQVQNKKSLTMRLRHVLKALILSLTGMPFIVLADEKPNIVIILTDDLC